jgi:hypothetical protein
LVPAVLIAGPNICPIPGEIPDDWAVPKREFKLFIPRDCKIWVTARVPRIPPKPAMTVPMIWLKVWAKALSLWLGWYPGAT